MSGTISPKSANVACASGRSTFASRNRSQVFPERGYETRKTSVSRTVSPRAAGGAGGRRTATRRGRSDRAIAPIAASLEGSAEARGQPAGAEAKRGRARRPGRRLLLLGAPPREPLLVLHSLRDLQRLLEHEQAPAATSERADLEERQPVLAVLDRHEPLVVG